MPSIPTGVGFFWQISLSLKEYSITNLTSFCWEDNILQLNRVSSCWELYKYFKIFFFYSVNSSFMLFLWMLGVVTGYVLKVHNFWAYTQRIYSSAVVALALLHETLNLNVGQLEIFVWNIYLFILNFLFFHINCKCL